MSAPGNAVTPGYETEVVASIASPSTDTRSNIDEST